MTAAWLVRIRVNRGSGAARADLHDAVSLHRRLMLLAPDGHVGPGARARAGMLHRVEGSWPNAVILAQCRVEPLVGRLPAGYGKVEVRKLDPLLNRLDHGMAVHYRIAANPTERPKREGGGGAVGGGGDVDYFAAAGPRPRERTVALEGDEVYQWWDLRAAGAGLKLLSASAALLRPSIGREGRAKVTHTLVRFDGRAVVADSGALREAVLAGIGRGKSYGAGLLSLALPAVHRESPTGIPPGSREPTGRRGSSPHARG